MADYRSEEAKEYRKLYKTARWQRMRDAQLSEQPLCCMCLALEEVTPATIVDHIKSHKGDLALFYDPNNLQSLCKPHHDGAKQRIDRGGRAYEIGEDGYPVELG